MKVFIDQVVCWILFFNFFKNKIKLQETKLVVILPIGCNFFIDGKI